MLKIWGEMSKNLRVNLVSSSSIDKEALLSHNIVVLNPKRKWSLEKQFMKMLRNKN